MANGVVSKPTPNPRAPQPVKGDGAGLGGLTGPMQTVHCSMPPITIGASARASPSRFTRIWYGMAPRAGTEAPLTSSIPGICTVGTANAGAGASGLTAMTPTLATATPVVNSERITADIPKLL